MIHQSESPLSPLVRCGARRRSGGRLKVVQIRDTHVSCVLLSAFWLGGVAQLAVDFDGLGKKDFLFAVQMEDQTTRYQFEELGYEKSRKRLLSGRRSTRLRRATPRPKRDLWFLQELLRGGSCRVMCASLGVCTLSSASCSPLRNLPLNQVL